MHRIYIKPEATLLKVETDDNLFATSKEGEEDEYGEAKPTDLEVIDEIWTNDKK